MKYLITIIISCSIANSAMSQAIRIDIQPKIITKTILGKQQQFYSFPEITKQFKGKEIIRTENNALSRGEGTRTGIMGDFHLSFNYINIQEKEKCQYLIFEIKEKTPSGYSECFAFIYFKMKNNKLQLHEAYIQCLDPN